MIELQNGLAVIDEGCDPEMVELACCLCALVVYY